MTTRISPALLESGVGSLGDDLYIKSCGSLGHLNGFEWMLKVTMGAFTDFFKPSDPASHSFCDIITGSHGIKRNYEWSPTGAPGDWMHVPDFDASDPYVLVCILSLVFCLLYFG